MEIDTHITRISPPSTATANDADLEKGWARARDLLVKAGRGFTDIRQHVDYVGELLGKVG